MNIACHACGDKKKKKKLCKDCHVAAYCGEECQDKHLDEHTAMCHVDDEIKVKHEFWTVENLEGPIYDAVQSKKLKRQIDAFCKTGATIIPITLKADIAHDLYIGNVVFQTYLKAILRSRKGARRIRDKLDQRQGRVSYASAYTDRQKAQILAVLQQDNTGKLDPEGVVRDYFTNNMIDDLMERYPKFFKRGTKRTYGGY